MIGCTTASFSVSKAPCVALLVVTWALAAGCTTVPTFRAPIDLPASDQQIEAGAGLQVLAGPNSEDVTQANGANAGVGVQGFAVYRTPWPVDVFAMGHGAGTLGIFPSIQRPGYIYGAQAGVRGRVEAIQGLVFSLEGYGDYLEQNIFGKTLRHVTGMASITIAENAYGPLWVYIRPTGGITIPLHAGEELPFAGVSEMPLGFTLDLNRNLSIRGEGGYHIPSGMISIATALVGSF